MSAEHISAEPGDTIAIRASNGRVKRYRVKDDGALRQLPARIGFRASCDCPSCETAETQ